MSAQQNSQRETFVPKWFPYPEGCFGFAWIRIILESCIQIRIRVKYQIRIRLRVKILGTLKATNGAVEGRRRRPILKHWWVC